MYLKKLFFLIQLIWICFHETMNYFIYYNYDYVTNLTHRLANINILYVKIFQAFALNNKWINDEINNKLLKFTDNAPWNFSDINLSMLVSMADKYNIKLKRGYEIPINSGMISLIFKGYNQNNEPVIIKMKRVNIDQILDESIDNLLFIIYLISFIPIIDSLQLTNIINKNILLLKCQTNFSQEVDNMILMKENCKNLKYIKIPSVDKSVTDEFPNIILMEFIDGQNISMIKQEDCEPFAKLVVKFGLTTTIVHGVVHGDLHSGNILFIKNEKNEYKLGIIDFGIIYHINTPCKNILFDLLTNLFQYTPRNCAIKLLHSNFFEPPNIVDELNTEEYNHLVSICEEIISDTLTNVHQIQIYKFLCRMKEYFSEKKIRVSNQLIQFQLILAMSHGMTMMLCKDDLIKIIDTSINELFHINLLLED